MSILNRPIYKYWIELEILLEPRDLWIGLYWKAYPSAIDFYICIIPIVPLRIYIQKMR